MRGFKIISWFYIISFLSFTVCSLEASSKENLQSAVVVGTVYCDTCFQEDFSKSSHFISGASVAVECKDETSKPSFRQEVKTDEHGEFKVHLPFSISKHVKKIKGCSVKLINSSEPYCAVASTATSSSLRLKSRKQGTHIFSAGFFTFKPLKQPNVCNQKPSLEISEEFHTKKTSFPPINNPTFPPPLQDLTTPDLPPLDPSHLPPLPLLPQLPPLPQLPLLPPLPGLPYLPPFPGKKTTETKPDEHSKATQTQLLESEQKVDHPDSFLPPLPTNPLQPPTILPPNPLLPPPLFPPNPLLPPPSPIIPLPPIPGIPLPPIPGIPLPPVPLIPPLPPHIPGIPPASSSPENKPSP